MKEVVKVIKDKVVDVDSVKDNKYYGFIISGNSPGQIHGEENNYPKTYQAKFFYYSTYGNSWRKKHNTLKGCIESLLDDPSTKVYEFDTYQDLFRWGISLQEVT